MGIASSRLAAALLLLAVATAIAQQSPSLSKKAEAVKHRIEDLAPHAPISVVPIHGDEAYGELLSHDPVSFTFRDIDLKADVTLKYEDVRKVKSGYGGYNSARGRHTDRQRALIVTAVVLVALGALIGAAVAASN
jgi:hypothetical protein